MKKSNWLTGIVLLLCIACTNVKETPRGLKYTVVRRGDGHPAKPGQILIMSMVFKDGKDSVWNDSRKGETPWMVMVQDTMAIKQEDGIDEIFRLLSKGDSITFKIQADVLFQKTFRQPLPPKIDPKSEFTFNMGVNDVYSREQAMKMQEQIVARQNEQFRKDQKEQLAKDIQSIDQYLEEKKIMASQDSSGLRYVITRAGKGLKPKVTQTVVVKYIGKLMDGIIFDQSAQPVTFPLANLIKGWQIGFPLLAVGGRATLYVPSTLGYGAKGYPPQIPSHANLIFEVELIGIK